MKKNFEDQISPFCNLLTSLKSPNIRNNYKTNQVFTSKDDGGRRGTLGFLVSSSGSDSDSDEEG